MYFQALLLLPGIIAVFLVVLILGLIPLLLIELYSDCRLTPPVRAVPRDCGFWTFCAILFLPRCRCPPPAPAHSHGV